MEAGKRPPGGDGQGGFGKGAAAVASASTHRSDQVAPLVAAQVLEPDDGLVPVAAQALVRDLERVAVQAEGRVVLYQGDARLQRLVAGHQVAHGAPPGLRVALQQPVEHRQQVVHALLLCRKQVGRAARDDEHPGPTVGAPEGDAAVVGPVPSDHFDIVSDEGDADGGVREQHRRQQVLA